MKLRDTDLWNAAVELDKRYTYERNVGKVIILSQLEDAAKFQRMTKRRGDAQATRAYWSLHLSTLRQSVDFRCPRLLKS